MPPETVLEVEGADVPSVARQLPSVDTLEPGARLILHAGKSRGWLGRLGVPPKNAPSPAVLGTALLARGYVALAAGTHGGRPAVWAEAPSASDY